MSKDIQIESDDTILGRANGFVLAWVRLSERATELRNCANLSARAKRECNMIANELDALAEEFCRKAWETSPVERESQ